MGHFDKNAKWHDKIYQIERTDPVVGGEGGISNQAPMELADRTEWLKQQIELQQCNSIAELRSIEPTQDKQMIDVKGYYANSTKGGGYFVADLEDTTTADNGGTVIVSNGGKRWLRVHDGLTTSDFGILPKSATPQTEAIQTALNVVAQARTCLEFESGDYVIESLTLPSGSTLNMAGAILKNKTASTGRVITVQDNVTVDELTLDIVGGEQVSGIKLCGSHIKIGRLSCVAEQASQYGVFVQSLNGSTLTGIEIDNVQIKHFRSAMPIFNVQQAKISSITIEQYVTGVYLRDVSQSYFEGANIRGTSEHSLGGAGNNGLLIESTLFSGSSNNLHFIGWNVRESGEHAYRLGGQLSIFDVWFTNCRAGKTGNANNNQATGGCGFKVLGATSVAGERHRNIYFDNCHIEDVNTQAKGQGNFAGFLISNADNIHITNSAVVAKETAYSAWHAYSLESVTNVFLSNNLADNARQHALRFVSSTYADHLGWDGLIKNVVIHGGSYGVAKAANSAVIYFTKGSGEAGRIEEVNMSGTRIKGGSAAIRIESYYAPKDCYFDFNYSDPQSTTGAPPLLGSPVLCTIRSKWYGSYGSSAQNGSVFIDTETGIVRKRINNQWEIEQSTTIRRTTLTASPLTNVDKATHVRSKYHKTGEIVQVSGCVEVKPTSAGRLAFLLEPPLLSASPSWADCSGTWNSADGVMHGTVTMDTAKNKLQFLGVSTTTEVRNCVFIASYLLV